MLDLGLFYTLLIGSRLSDFSVWSKPPLGPQFWPNNRPWSDKKRRSQSRSHCLWFSLFLVWKHLFGLFRLLTSEPEKGKTKQQDNMSCGSTRGDTSGVKRALVTVCDAFACFVSVRVFPVDQSLITPITDKTCIGLKLFSWFSLTYSLSHDHRLYL